MSENIQKYSSVVFKTNEKGAWNPEYFYDTFTQIYDTKGEENYERKRRCKGS